MSAERTGAPDDAEFQAWVDGRLDGRDEEWVQTWLNGHPDKLAALSADSEINQALHREFDPVLDEPVPARLSEMRRSTGGWRKFLVAASLMAIGGAVGAMVTLAGVSLRGESRSTATPIAQRAAIAHATYSPEVRHPVEVGASEEKHLVAWLSKRLGFELRAPQLTAEGFSLVGGRLLSGDGGKPGAAAPVAQFMYQCDFGRRITLYVQPEMAGHQETAFRFSSQGSVSVFYWADHNLGYALSSVDVGREELLKVANTIFKQLNP
jgi:anti-sigma factor RsiW